ncbi:MAG: hypothetical protein ACU833_05300 [Gammaproteobacteria bacterium]
MNEPDPLSAIQTEYRAVLRRMKALGAEATQDNTVARMAYDQCRIALENGKQTMERLLREYKSAEAKEKDYVLRAARNALRELKDRVSEAENKVNKAKPMPPFMY